MRSALTLPVLCRVPATPREATILDISVSGCLIQAPGNLEVGATIIVSLPLRREVSGMIVWSRAGHAGVRFHSALSADLVDAVAALPDETRIAKVA